MKTIGDYGEKAKELMEYKVEENIFEGRTKKEILNSIEEIEIQVNKQKEMSVRLKELFRIRLKILLKYFFGGLINFLKI